MDHHNTISEIPAVQRRIRDSRIVPARAKDGHIVSPEQQALDPRRGYALGLLLLDHRVTQDQHDIGMMYAEDMARYYGLSGIGFPSPRAQNLFSVHGVAHETESRAEAARRARTLAKRFDTILLAVGDIDTGRRVAHAIKQVCVLDVQEARCWPEHMLDYLRRGLNALGKRHYRMERE